MNGALITFTGNLTADPELRFTPSGQAVANFTVVSNERKFDKTTNEWVEGDPTFLRCSVWQQVAENVAESLSKGDRVVVSGTLRVRQYDTKEGGTGTSVECNVDEIGASLRWATTRIDRNPKGQQKPQQKGQSRQKAAASDQWSSSDSVPF